MAGFGFLGALAGSSGQALDAIKQRQEREREERKLRMLEELRRDTAVYLADYEEKLKSDDVDDKLSSFDPTTGEFITRNKEGKELGRRADPGMMEEYQFGKQKNALALDVAKANIRQSDASAEASRASAAVSRKSLSKLDEADVPPTIMDRANEIAFRQKTLVEDLIDGGVPAEAVQLTIVRSLQNAMARNQPASAAENYFIQAADTLRTKYRSSSSNTNKIKAQARSEFSLGG